MQSQTVGGITLVEVEPGAPLPPGVPETAIRCELVETPDLSPRWKPWVIGTGAVGTLGSVAALFLTLWAVVPFILALVLFYYGIAPLTSPVVVPSETGRYLGFEEARDEEEEGSRTVGRLAAIAVGAVMAGASIVKVFTGDRSDWLLLGTLGAIGCYLLYVGLTGDDGEEDAPIARPASLRFLVLADPTRPLDAADPVTTAPPRAIDAAAPSPDALPAEGGARGARGFDAD